MKLLFLSYRHIIICFILSIGLDCIAQPVHTQYLLPSISGTGISKDFQRLSSINIPFNGITIQTDDSTSYMLLKWRGLKANSLGAKPRFRLCVVSEQRTFQYLEVLSAKNKLIGTMDLSISASFQIIEFQIPIEKLKTVDENLKVVVHVTGLSFRMKDADMSIDNIYVDSYRVMYADTHYSSTDYCIEQMVVLS